MGALRFLLRRLAFSAALILGVSLILFALINAIGNPIEILLAEPPGVSEEMIAAVSNYYGLDGNFIDRYRAWLGPSCTSISAPASSTTSRSASCSCLGLETLKIQLPAILIALHRDRSSGSSAATRQHALADFAAIVIGACSAIRCQASSSASC